ncbi:MAG: hypothetical protein R3E31_28850 [Chloroflexota bacterium]
MNDSRTQREQALQRQVQRLAQRLNELHEISNRLSRLRLALFLGATAVSFFTLFKAGPWPWVGVSILTSIPFLVAVARHRRIQRAITQHHLWRQIKQAHLARMALDWEHIPATLPAPPRLEHPFAYDLDLLGERSLLRLLDTAVSHGGSDRLQQWLLQTQPDPAAIRQRQAVVRELAAMPRFRDKLVLNATLAAGDDDETAVGRDKWPGQRVLDWLTQQDMPHSLRPILIVLSSLTFITIPLLLLNLANVLPPWWLLTWVPFVLLSGAQTRQVGPLFKDASFLADGLRKLQAVFGFLETYPYAQNNGVQAICQPFLDERKRPSQQLRRVTRIITAAGIQYNPILWLLLNALLPWDIYFAWRMHQLKRDLQNLLPRWLDIWYELEALSSLATFAYLNPGAIFADVVTEATAVPLFQATALGHPLIAADHRVSNDFQIDQTGSVTIITGSNMAGKSSFLRTLGINLCLAYAGGPVIADTLRTHLFRLYTSIQVNDSVTDGFSFFYAEVRRLQSMLAALQQEADYPLFFLIDEIFRGTNNRERLIGSRAYVQALVGGNGVGVIATHDLELVRLADSSPQVRNFHFRDDVENGRMVFDYMLHTGPCPTTNALKIMRMAGLPVPDGDAP